MVWDEVWLLDGWFLFIAKDNAREQASEEVEVEVNMAAHRCACDIVTSTSYNIFNLLASRKANKKVLYE
jgi:hypothetical protein